MKDPRIEAFEKNQEKGINTAKECIEQQLKWWKFQKKIIESWKVFVESRVDIYFALITSYQDIKFYFFIYIYLNFHTH